MRGIRIVAGLLCGGLAVGTSRRPTGPARDTLGGVLARGNTETETINANIDVAERCSTAGRTSSARSILHTVNDDITSADRWELRGEANYTLTERSYLFGTLRYEDDAFTDFAYQATAGRRLWLPLHRDRDDQVRGADRRRLPADGAAHHRRVAG